MTPALANIEHRAELWSGNPAEIYEAARHLGQFILNSKNSGGATPEAKTRSEELAVDLLRRAAAAGFQNAKGVAEDGAFTKLRGRADFQEVLAAMKLAGASK
jgi:hypothetical protein